MTNQEWLNFELIIADMVENIKDPEELSGMSEEIHTYVERALYDHASDNGFLDDYEPCF